MISSYQRNNLGWVLADQVLKYNPKIIIEFGVLHGYSTFWMAAAVKHGHTADGTKLNGHIYAYDLWEEYEYVHSNKKQVQQTIDKRGYSNFITLGTIDFFDWIKEPEPFNLLHLDISNDGDIIELAIDRLSSQIKQGSIIIFEGGSEERDQEDWMIKYNKRPIQSIRDRFPYQIINQHWPSISMVDKTCL